MKITNVNEMPLLAEDSISGPLKEKLAKELAAIKGANEMLNIPIMREVFQFSGAAFADSIVNVLKQLEDGKVITVGGLSSGRGFLKEVRDSVEERTLTGAATALRFPASDWPEKGTYPGITTILGQMYAGKTHYVRHDAKVDIVLRYGEPLEDIDDEVLTDDDSRKLVVLPVTNFVEMLEYAMILSFLGYRVAVDSFRKLVFSLTGAALSGGIMPAIFDVLTNVNNSFAAIGRHAMITVNPMLKDSADLHRYFELMAASVGGAVLLEDQRVTGWTYRTAEGRKTSRPIMPEMGSVDSRSLSDREASSMPYPGLNMQKISDESEWDHAGTSIGQNPSAEDVEDAPVRMGANFHL